MAPRPAYTLFVVFGFVLILGALGYALQTGHYNNLLVIGLGSTGLYLLLTNLWAHALTPEPEAPTVAIGACTHAAVVGLLLILALLTIRLLHLTLSPVLVGTLGIPGVLLIALGLAASSAPGTSDPPPRYHAAVSTGPVGADGRYGMAPHTACAVIATLGTVLILTVVAILLQLRTYDPTLLAVVGGVGLFLILSGWYLYRKTGIVQVIHPHPQVAGATVLVVLGFCLLLARLTLALMHLPVALQQSRIMLIIGALLIALGFVLNSGGRQLVRVTAT